MGVQITSPLGAGSLVVPGPLTINGDLDMSGHLVGTGVTPGITAQVGAGTGPTVSVVGTDLAGKVTLIFGTTPAAGNLFVVTFAVNYGTVPRAVNVTPANAVALALQATTAVVAANAFNVQAGVAGVATQTAVFYYEVVS